MSDTPVKVKDAEITEDGLIIIEFNEKLTPSFVTNKAVFAPEVLIALAIRYGEIPPREETDYPGIPLVAPDKIDLEHINEADDDDEEEGEIDLNGGGGLVKEDE